MASPAAVLSVLVRANTASANLGLARVNATARMTASHLGEVDDKSIRAQHSLRRMGKVAAAAAGSGGLLALGLAAKKGFQEFQEAEKATAQTQAALKSTGNQAKITADQIQQLANQISLKSGIDDEAIQSGENLLLTFTKIRNETGKGNDIFNQATQTITDMSVALNQDLKSSAIQVGKALQDPEKGMTALRRVGVNFTQVQSDMVKGWVAHGQQLRAQKFILRELTTEFGGSAAAQATASQKLQAAFNNVMESFGRAFGPTLEKGMAALARFLNQMETGTGAGGDFARVLKVIGRGIEEVVVSFVHFGKWVLNAIHNVDRFGDGTRHVIFAIGRWFSDTFNNIKRIFGNVMAFIFRKFATLFDIASHLPGIGSKFGDLRDKALAFAASADRAGEKTQSLADKLRHLKSRDIQVRVDMAFSDPTTPHLVPLPHGGPGLEDLIRGGTQRQAQRYVNRHMDEFAPLLGAPGAAKGGLKKIQQISLAMGLSGGLGPGQGYRPGDPGYHGLGRALDNSGPAAAMMAFARRMFSEFGSRLKELIYSPMGVGIKNGRPVNILDFYGPSVYADHFDHVHVAMQKGGGIPVPGTGAGDKIPIQALVEPGERVFVLNRNAVPAFDAINSMFPRFQSGGMLRAAKAGRNAGFRGSALQYLLAIGAAESGDYTNLYGDQAYGGSYGPWQINHPAHPQYNTRRLMTDWTYAAKAAYAISGGGRNWSPWTMYRNGGYQRWMGQAASAIRKTAAKAKRQARHVAHKVKRHTAAAPRAPGSQSPADIRDAFMQAWAGGIDMRAALAALTPGTADDLAVAQDAIRGWAGWLAFAKRKHDQALITTAATNLKAAWESAAEFMPQPATTAGAVDDSGRVALLQQLLQEANLRTGVSQAQYGVFRGMPTVGAPRFGYQSGGQVQPILNVNFSGNASWLERFVDHRIEQTTRRQRSTSLPGRGGGLQR